MSSSSNRRRQPRRFSSGPVTIHTDKLFGEEIAGELLDISTGGFRAACESKDLERGDHVRFSHPGGTGTAVVIWTRVAESGMEAGFQFIDAIPARGPAAQRSRQTVRL